MSPSNLPRTVGELRAAGHRERGVKQEIRENLLTALADGDNVWPGGRSGGTCGVERSRGARTAAGAQPEPPVRDIL